MTCVENLHRGQRGGRKSSVHTCSGKHSSACQCLPPNMEPFPPPASLIILSLSRFFPTFNDVLAACARLTELQTTQSRSFWQEPVSSALGLQTKPHMGARPVGDSSFDSGNMLQPPHNRAHTHIHVHSMLVHKLWWLIPLLTRCHGFLTRSGNTFCYSGRRHYCCRWNHLCRREYRGNRFDKINFRRSPLFKD